MKFEEILNQDKEHLADLNAPEEMEARLRNALETRTTTTTPGRSSRHFKTYAASVLVLLALTMFNFDAIAYYGKQLLGYEQVMNGTLKQLSELGKGQPIGKSYTFEDGVSFTVDYVMVDENQLLLFYTVTDPAGQVEEITNWLTLDGFWGDYNQQSGQGNINEDNTEIKWITSFEAPKPLEKKLTLHINRGDQPKLKPGAIRFNLDRNQAMGHTLKKDLNQSITLEHATIKLDSLLASPTQTVIKGSIQNIFELAKDHLSGERLMPTRLEFRLMANGQRVQLQGGGTSTNMKGITFEQEFDALPTDLTKLQLELVSFGAEQEINQQFTLDNSQEQQLTIEGKSITINNLRSTGEETLVTITSEEDLILSKIYLLADGERISLEETITDNYDKQNDGTITHTRTLRFLGTGEQLALDIQRMTYSRDYNELVEIPID